MNVLDKYYYLYKLATEYSTDHSNETTPSQATQNYLNLLLKRALLFGLLGGGLAALSPVLIKYLEKQPIAIQKEILKGLPTGLGLGAITGMGIGTLEALNKINYAINTGQMDQFRLPPAILEAINKLRKGGNSNGL